MDLVDQAQAQMLALTQSQSTEEDPLPVDYMPRALDRIEQRRNNGAGGLQGLPTGFADLDALTNGLLPKQMIVVGARPSVGKTTFALDWARQAAIRADAPVAFFSLEMGEEEITDRLLSAEARVPLHTIKSGMVTDDQWDRMGRVLPSITESQLVIKTGISRLAQIRAACRRMKRSLGLRMVVVDYLQLVIADGRYDNKNAEVTEVSRALKLLAVELDVTVVALSQLNRKSEDRQDRKPQMSDLRESGAVEQDADMVVLLYREDVHDKESPRSGEADLLVVKHRNGPTAELTVAFNNTTPSSLTWPRTERERRNALKGWGRWCPHPRAGSKLLFGREVMGPELTKLTKIRAPWEKTAHSGACDLCRKGTGPGVAIPSRCWDQTGTHHQGNGRPGPRVSDRYQGEQGWSHGGWFLGHSLVREGSGVCPGNPGREPQQ